MGSEMCIRDSKIMARAWQEHGKNWHMWTSVFYKIQQLAAQPCQSVRPQLHRDSPMARTRVKLRLPDEGPLRKDYFLPVCGVPVLGAGTDGFVVRAFAQRSSYSDALQCFRGSANDSEREIQALQAIGRPRYCPVDQSINTAIAWQWHGNIMAITWQ